MLLDERESGASKPRRKHPIFNLREKEFEPIGVTRKPFHCEHDIGLSNFLPPIDRSILSQFTVGLRKKGDKKENISLGRSDEGGAFFCWGGRLWVDNFLGQFLLTFKLCMIFWWLACGRSFLKVETQDLDSRKPLLRLKGQEPVSRKTR